MAGQREIPQSGLVALGDHLTPPSPPCFAFLKSSGSTIARTKINLFATQETAAPSADQYASMRRLHEVFQARLKTIQQARAKLSARINMLDSAHRIGHLEYSKIFSSIEDLYQSIALEQKLRHEVTMLEISTFTAFQVSLAVAIRDPLSQSTFSYHDHSGPPQNQIPSLGLRRG